jgi:hypothetical protein
MTVLPAHHSSQEHPEVQQPEGVATVKAVVVAIICLVVFFFATLWSVRIFEGEERKIAPQGTISPPKEIGNPQMGLVNQRLFELQREAGQKRTEQLARLNSYGWVDREKRIIHIPIDRAMEKLSQGSKK